MPKKTKIRTHQEIVAEAEAIARQPGAKAKFRGEHLIHVVAEVLLLRDQSTLQREMIDYLSREETVKRTNNSEPSSKEIEAIKNGARQAIMRQRIKATKGKSEIKAETFLPKFGDRWRGFDE